MGTPNVTPARTVADRATARLHEALKPLLTAAGVRAVEERIGRPRRFFQKTRERDAMRLSDYLATCVALGLDPARFLAQALEGDVEPEIRRPRIVARARAMLEGEGGPGLGEQRLAELDAALQVEPKSTRESIVSELEHASREEVPRLLGFYGSCLRVESSLARAELVLREALEMVEAHDLMGAEPDLLIRRAYVVLEHDRPAEALHYAMEATLAFGRLEDREGEGRGYLTTGMLRFYAHDYRKAVRDLEASQDRCNNPHDQFAAHQIAALSWLALKHQEEARREAARARELAPRVPPWSVAKLDWLESRLATGEARLERLAAARAGLSVHRPADCALVAVELIEEALNQERHELAERETTDLCALIDRTSSPRIEAAILHLVRHQAQLTPELAAKVRRAVERARDRRLARLAGPE
jgi:tetratricopeptide (TPR) repeat protein